MTNVFTELQDSFFFYPKQSLANNVDLVPYQPVLCVFNSVIDKKKKKNFALKLANQFHIKVSF